MEPAAYVNGFVDGADLVLLYRDARGEMMARRRRAEWSNFFRRAHVTPQILRELRDSSYVSRVSEEGPWLRVCWSAREWREMAHAEEVKAPDGKWVPGYVAGLGVESFEADVGPARRFFSETGAAVAPPRRCYVDIETDSRVPPALAKRGKARVLCWSIAVDDSPERDASDPEGLRVAASAVLAEDTDDAEAALLEAFWRAAEPYDQMAAWFGDGFDFPILKTRSDILGARAKDPRRWLYVDQMVAHERMNRNAAESGAEKESMALDFVANELIGDGKIDFDASKTWAAWEAGGAERARLLRYCEHDTLLLPRIERKTGYLALHAVLCEIARCFQETASLLPISIVDGVLLRMGVERGIRFPSRRREEGQHQKFAGAFVLEPTVSGIRRNVHVFDFSGMYPSIMMSWNISPETRRPCTVSGPIDPGLCRSPATRVGFATSPAGIIPEALKQIRERRKEWQKRQAALPAGTADWYDAGRRSNAYKVAANVFYGAAGSPHCRFFDRACAESTSQTGAWLIKKTLHEAEAREGMLAAYGDTDSGFVENATREQVARFVAWCNRDLYPPAVAAAGCVENHIEVAYEKEFERLVLVGKKRYFGVFRHYKWSTTCACETSRGGPGSVDVRTMTCRDCGRKWDELPPARGRPEVKGLEYKRGDAHLLARQLQYAVIELFCSGVEDPAAYVPLVEAARRHVLEDPLPVEEVRLSQSVTKSLKEYKTKEKKDGTQSADLAHVAVARILKARGELVGEGTRIQYYVVDASESPMRVAPAVDYVGDCDRYYLWEQRIYPATQRVLEATFPAARGMGAEELQMRDWGRFLRARPKRERAPRALAEGAAPRAPARAKRAAAGQGDLFAPPAPPPAPPPKGAPFVVEIDDVDRVDAIRDVLLRHPGDRPVVIEISFSNGVRERIEVEDARVAVSPAFVREVAIARGAAA